MGRHDSRWVARLTPTPSTTTESLLEMALGLDVWERHPDELIVAASESQLAELKRRRLALVEQLATVEEYVRAAQEQARSEDEGSIQ